MTQIELIKDYFQKKPNLNIEHPEVVDWAVSEWAKLTGRVLRDPDRCIRKLHQEGFLVKVSKGIYKYDPTLEHKVESEDFTTNQKNEILLRDNHRCVICGVNHDLQVDHIKPKHLGGKATIENGQTLCSKHNLLKKTLGQADVGRKMFLRLKELSINDNKLSQFCNEILSVYDKYQL